MLEKVSKNEIVEGSLIRLGGLVLEDSFSRDSNRKVFFIITDNSNEIFVTYKGILPDLFEEGQGVIAEGFLRINKNSLKHLNEYIPQNNKVYFEAEAVLAKHDENYMPPEVAESLEMGSYGYD